MADHQARRRNAHILGGVFVVIQERGRLASVVHSLSGYQKQIASEQPPSPRPAVAVTLPPARPNPLRPTDYGVYAVDNDSLSSCSHCPAARPTSALRYPPP
jgi:hypothetical protein